MVKKIFIGVLIGLVAFLYQISLSFATTCVVSTSSDDNIINPTLGSLRDQIETYNTSNYCSISPSCVDHPFFDNNIFFQTAQFAPGASRHLDQVVIGNSGQMDEPIVFRNNDSDVMIGNWPGMIDESAATHSLFLSDPEYYDIIVSAGDFGHVVIDGTVNFSSGHSPFRCETNKNVYFRNVTIRTKGPLDDCIKNGGNLIVEIVQDPITNPINPDPNQTTETDADLDGVSVEAGDCDDANAAIYPQAAEICDGMDNDCDGDVDEGLETNTYYADQDSDGFGWSDLTMEACQAPEYFVMVSGDCNDLDASIHPDASETCNSTDANCDGDPNPENFAQICQGLDIDGDGFVAVEDGGTDCNDDDTMIHPNAVETVTTPLTVIVMV